MGGVQYVGVDLWTQDSGIQYTTVEEDLQCQVRLDLGALNPLSRVLKACISSLYRYM